MTDSVMADHTQARGPYDVVTEDVWIEMPDGCRLFGIVHRPNAGEAVPGILTATPYGVKVGGNREELPILTYLASLGYGTLQLDLRGSCDSEGIPEPEYSEQEQNDLVAVVAWIARQQWCTGRVGMRGMSWSGVNTLQVAARRPPELKAIISGCSMDDIYGDGDFFLGGCQFAWDHLWWGTLALMVQAQAPSPEVHGDRWVELWRERLQQVHVPVSQWLEHQRCDGFWLDRSVCRDYSAIEIPTLMFSGYLDGYPGAVFRVVAAAQQAWGIIGPWAHLYPYQGRPGPSISVEFEIRWWERWLKEVENGVDQEPRLRVFVRDPRPLRPAPEMEPGRWVGMREWPAGEPLKLDLARSQLSIPADGDRLSFSTPLATGIDAPPWCVNVPAEYDQPPDQRAEDGRSLCFTTAPLERSLDIVATPALTLTLSADQPVAKLAVRLCHVMADGSSRLLAVGALNLTHRHSHVEPEPVTPGEAMRVRVELRPVGNHVPAGDRLRIALSPNYWPWIWPAPKPVTLTLHLDEPTELELPLVPRDATELTFEPGQSFLAVEPLTELKGRRTVTTDLGTGETRRDEPATGSEFSIIETDPTSATVRVAFRARPGRPHTLEVSSTTTVDEWRFFHEARVVARIGDELIAERSFKSSHERDYQ